MSLDASVFTILYNFVFVVNKTINSFDFCGDNAESCKDENTRKLKQMNLISEFQGQKRN